MLIFGVTFALIGLLLRRFPGRAKLSETRINVVIYVLDLLFVAPLNRTDEQNNAVHGLIDQVLKARPFHCGLRMSKESYKAIFMHALGREARMLPTLDGDGLFPLGLSTSKLTIGECRDLIEFILAWCAKEGIEIHHFDDGHQGGAGAKNLRAEAA